QGSLERLPGDGGGVRPGMVAQAVRLLHEVEGGRLGWPEIPHLYPIGAFFLLAFSNQLSNELDGEPRAAGDRRWWRSRWGLATATALSWLLIFPLLYALTLTQRPFLRASATTRASRPTEIGSRLA